MMRTVLQFLVLATLVSPAVADTHPLPRIAVLPIKLLDTSAEPRDQTHDHARRLAILTSGIAESLSNIDPFRTVKISREMLQGSCPLETADCLLRTARAHGASIVLLGVVHKSSTLIMRMWIRLVDASTGFVVFSRDLNFRGDNDDAWQRAKEFLITEIKSAPSRWP